MYTCGRCYSLNKYINYTRYWWVSKTRENNKEILTEFFVEGFDGILNINKAEIGEGNTTDASSSFYYFSEAMFQ